MDQPEPHRLPAELCTALRSLEPMFMADVYGSQHIERILVRLDALPAAAVGAAAIDLPWALGILGKFDHPSQIELVRARRLARLNAIPGLEHLFLFHADGRLREAALDRIDGGARSAFFFAAIALRLNDWAEPVRKAALRCAGRVFDRSSDAIVAEAASYLIARRLEWQRWTPIESAVLDRALDREGVVEQFVERICTARTGKAGRLLGLALRGGHVDRWLGSIAGRACLPNVRRVALEALIRREARWPTHRVRVWIDKSMGRYRDGCAYASRPIESSVSAEEAALIAARDPSAMVRRSAVVALLTDAIDLANFDAVAAVLAEDRRPALRERTAFAIRRREERASISPS